MCPIFNSISPNSPSQALEFSKQQLKPTTTSTLPRQMPPHPTARLKIILLQLTAPRSSISSLKRLQNLIYPWLNFQSGASASSPSHQNREPNPAISMARQPFTGYSILHAVHAQLAEITCCPSRLY